MTKNKTKNLKINETNLPKSQKPLTKESFGYWLAGLIDGDGYIDKQGYIIITFSQRDASVAYYIKHVVGAGRILHRATYCNYRARCKFSMQTIGNLVLNKLRNPKRINQYNSRLCQRIGNENTGLISGAVSLENHWLAGFIQADGSFQIQINDRTKYNNEKPQIIVVIQISQKSESLLAQIKQSLDGVIYYSKPQNYYIYSSSNFANAGKFINYLDCYQVIGSSFRIYELWRKACLSIQAKQHLSQCGREYIRCLKKQMTKLKQSKTNKST